MNSPDDRHLFFAFSTFTGERSTFDAWYDTEHIPQVLDAPGMVGAQRFVVAGTKPLPGTDALDFGHLAYYELAGDPGAFREEVKRKLMSGEMVLPSFMVQPFTALFLEPVSEPIQSERFSQLTSFGDRHLFLVFSHRPEDSATYDKWYDEVHIPQITSAPGFLRAQRFVTADTKPLPGVKTPELGHLALYETEGDLGPLREEVKRQLISGEMALPDFMQPPFGAMFLRPVSPFANATGQEGAR
ncbi:MAG TPA: hypothetical protein VH089_25580 [Streptosporangiaceae bacterium]|jgi:hypothetical protein|nr:hypothetical protein [Streptosporangiaceae bacterium]